MSNFIGMVFATLKKEGIDTSKMDTSEAIAKYNEIQGGSGGSSAKGEETPKTEQKTAGTGKETAEKGTTEKDSADATVSKKETVEGNKTSIPKEHQAKVNYLKDKINNSWYANAKMDYGVNGSVKDISVSGNTMKITVEEDGKTMTSTINYIDDYSPEQLYNIWQEFPDNDSSNEMQSAEKITSSMGISPDEAKAFVSGKGSLSNDGIEDKTDYASMKPTTYSNLQDDIWNKNYITEQMNTKKGDEQWQFIEDVMTMRHNQYEEFRKKNKNISYEDFVKTKNNLR